MSNFTLLEEDQIFGNSKLDIFNKLGTKAAITDFSILLGGYVSDSYHADGKNTLASRTGYYWTKTDDGDNDARAVHYDGDDGSGYVSGRDGGFRPALTFSSISNIPTNGVSRRDSHGILEVEYGYYPQTVADENTSRMLEVAFNNRTMNKTGNSFTTDSEKYDNRTNGFKPKIHSEYEYMGKRYVRVIANSCYDGSEFTLSNNKKYKDGDVAWVAVEPITWKVDVNKNIMITEKLIFSGIQFNKDRNYVTSNFNNTNIKRFLDNHFYKDISNYIKLNAQITATQTNITNSNENNNNVLRKQNPYNFNFDYVSEEEIIKGAIESGVAVFLHGLSSDGKSARIKQLDPDCEIIYLRNATPESLNGKSVYNSNTGELIDVPPTWYKKIVEKCKAEPDKIHIVFFDEITNALQSIQGAAFNIVLDREVNGIWKLPDNCRVAAAGNDVKDSMAANELAEPLFNRFAHVYINTTVDQWLKWAVTPTSEYERLDYRDEKPCQ